MKIGRQLNTLSYTEYLHLLQNYSRFTDFNSLGLFRSILENEKLTIEQQMKVRDISISTFPKFFAFLQVKDPWIFRKLTLLGQDFTIADEQKIINNIHHNQQKILNNKRIKHRNFGVYSKHSCGYTTCKLNNIMVKQGSLLTEYDMAPRKKYSSLFSKAERRKQERKREQQIIQISIAELSE